MDRWGWLLVEKRSEPALRRFAASPRGWALANLKCCQRDMTAAHSHAVAAASRGLDGTRHARADELVVCPSTS